MTIFAFLDRFSKTLPHKICLINGSTAVTYRELSNEVELLASKLASRFNKGEKILVKHAEPIKQLCLLLAASKAGVITILIDPLADEFLIQETMKKAGASCCIDAETKLHAGEVGFLPNISESDIFLGALSSGSSGKPKLIWRDHQSWRRAFPVQSRVFNLSSEDILLIAGSLIYTANLNSCLHLLHEGGTVVISKKAVPRTWIKEIKAQEITAVFMVPTNYRILLNAVKEPMKKVMSLISAGAKMNLNTVEELLKVFPQARFYEYYGTGELGHISYASSVDLQKNPDSVGKQFPGVKIWTENEEIWVESPYLAPDYSPKAGSGDLGFINDEGFLFLLGRKDNVINKGGVKVLAEQVEKVLSLYPGVVEAAVGGLADLIRGEKVVAWIERDTTEITAKELRSHCRKNLPKHYRPQEYNFIDKIPKNANGKVDRKRLKAGLV